MTQDLVQNKRESPQNEREEVVCKSMFMCEKNVIFDPTLQPNRKDLLRNIRTVVENSGKR